MMHNFLLPFTASPMTGDHRNVILYAVIAVIAAALIGLFLFLGKKKKK